MATASYTIPLKKIINSDAAYAILDKSAASGCTWMQGGCAILATALHKVYGFPIYVVYNNKQKQAEHLVVEVSPGKYMDGETIDEGRHYTKEEMLSGESFEKLPDLSLIKYERDINYGDIVFDEKVSEALADLIKKESTVTSRTISELEKIKRKYPNRKILIFDVELKSGGPVQFISVPIADLTTSLKDFQGRAEAYSSDTYNRIKNEVADGTFNFSALPAIQIWKDTRTGKWVILAGHSRTAAFTDLSSGSRKGMRDETKLPMDKKYKPEDFSHIHAQIFEAATLEQALQEAKKVAQESNISGVQSDIDFAGYVRSMRPTFKTQKEYWDKLNLLFGGNAIWIDELSRLNPDGKTMNMLRALSGITDKAQRAEIDKIASYIGAIREKLPVITDAHEDEIYTWLHQNLNNEKAKDKISSKNAVVSEIAARTQRMWFDPEKPLNLNNIGTKTYIAQSHDEQILEKEKAITEKQKEYRDLRDRYFAERVPTDKIEELLDPADKYILRLQRELRDLKLKDIGQANRTILGLFDTPAQPGISPEDTKALEEKLKVLLGMLRIPPNPQKGEPQRNAKPDLNAMVRDKPVVYGPLGNRVVKFEYNPISDKIEAYNYPHNHFLMDTVNFYKQIGLVENLSLAEPENYKPFRSEILNADYTNADPIYRYQVFPPFLLDQLDWWMSEFEARYLTKKISETARWNFVPQTIIQKYGFDDVEMLKQILETAIHIFTDYLIKTGTDDKQTYDRILNFYNHQPVIKWRSSNSLLLQQYSTPIPIAYLMSRFCIPAPKFGDRYLEPSAGTGLLTIGSPAAMWTVNEYDKDRLLCLQFLGFHDTHNMDSNQQLPFEKVFDAMLTNPPFGSSDKYDFDGYKIKKLEHRMAAFAMRCLKDTGKAAIIIGGGGYDETKLYDLETGMMLPYETNRVFFSWLYKYYNVVDVININGMLYSRMGAAAPIRVILIDGESTLTSQPHPYYYQDIKDLPPEKRNSPHQVKDYGVLFQRFYND